LSGEAKGSRGVGLKIEGFEDVRVNKLSPKLLENMGITIENGRLVVPISLSFRPAKLYVKCWIGMRGQVTVVRQESWHLPTKRV